MEQPLAILAVAEDPNHRVLLVSALVEAVPGCRAVEADGAPQALEILRAGRFDAVVCGYHLGPSTGLDLLGDARQAGVDAPFLLVTRSGSEDVARRAFLAGVSDYLTKDVAFQNPEHLGRRLRSAVERHRMARQRQRAEEMLENFLENNPFAILLLDPGGRVTRWNRALERMETRPGTLGAFLSGYLPAEDPQLREVGVTERLARARAGERVDLPAFSWDPRRAGLECAPRFFEGVVFPVGPRGEEPGHLCVMIHDVTSSETAHRERDEYAAVLSGLLDASQTAIFFVDTDLRVRFTNRRVQDFFGVEPSDLLGRPRTEVAARIADTTTHPEEFLERLRNLYPSPDVEDGHPVEVLRPFRRHLRRYSGPIRAADGRSLGRIEVYLDETDTVERQVLLEAENRDLDAFASRLAHELKTPLVSLKGFADLLSRQYSALLDPRGRMYLDRVGSSAALLGEMVDGLRDLARAGEPARTTAQVDLLPVLRLVNDNLSALAEKNQVTVELPPHAPAVRCDRAPLFQILQNLLSNAIRYADPGKSQRWVRVDIAEEELRVRVSVADNGVGMNEEEREDLFQPFRRGHSAAHTPGLGLGLAITLRLLQSCGGRIYVESAPGTGSCFTVELPRSLPPSGPPPG